MNVAKKRYGLCDMRFRRWYNSDLNVNIFTFGELAKIAFRQGK
jgi:hypothetical protein